MAYVTPWCLAVLIQGRWDGRTDTDVEQIGDLFRYLHEVGNASGPKGVPEGIDLRAEFPGELMTPFVCRRCCARRLSMRYFDARELAERVPLLACGWKRCAKINSPISFGP